MAAAQFMCVIFMILYSLLLYVVLQCGGLTQAVCQVATKPQSPSSAGQGGQKIQCVSKIWSKFQSSVFHDSNMLQLHKNLQTI